MTQTPDPQQPGPQQPDAPRPEEPRPEEVVPPAASDAPLVPTPEMPASELPDAEGEQVDDYEEEIVPLLPPDPADSELPEPEPEPEPFSGGPPPLPKPLLVLDGELPPEPQPEPVEEVDHGTCRCGGKFDADGWCTECGERRADPRHHFSAQPHATVAGVCDRGIRHEDNEDAMAVWGDDSRAALVVCDGVTTATRSAEGSLAAAFAALEVLTTSEEAPQERLVRAAAAAGEAVEEVGREFPDAAPSCTIVSAVVEDGLATVGNIGDSRAYWIPDEGEAVRLTRDDSMAEEQVDSGIDRATAEAGPLAHTITKWLGSDSPDHVPSISTQDVSAPGWLLLCSDGLWNYASDPADLRAVVRAEQQRVGDDPLAMGQGLVDWAKGRGGADNITVTLLRTGAAAYPKGSAGEDGATTSGQDGHHG